MNREKGTERERERERGGEGEGEGNSRSRGAFGSLRSNAYPDKNPNEFFHLKKRNSFALWRAERRGNAGSIVDRIMAL